MIKINLVPQEILDKEARQQQMRLVGAAGAIVFIAFAGVSFNHYYSGVKLAKHLEVQEAKYKKLEKIVQQVEALEAKARAVKARLDVMDDLIKSREFYPVFMTELLRFLPGGIWIDSLSIGGGREGLSVTLPSNALSVADVTDWIRVLENSDTFSGAGIGALTFAEDGKVTFSMSTTYKEKKEGKKKK